MPVCRTCEVAYDDDVDEGWDGECPPCAAVTAREQRLADKADDRALDRYYWGRP